MSNYVFVESENSCYGHSPGRIKKLETQTGSFFSSLFSSSPPINFFLISCSALGKAISFNWLPRKMRNRKEENMRLGIIHNSKQAYYMNSLFSFYEKEVLKARVYIPTETVGRFQFLVLTRFFNDYVGNSEGSWGQDHSWYLRTVNYDPPPFINTSGWGW